MNSKQIDRFNVMTGIVKTQYRVKKYGHGFALVKTENATGLAKPKEDKRSWLAKLLFPLCFQTINVSFDNEETIAVFNTEEELMVYADLQGIDIGKLFFSKLK